MITLINGHEADRHAGIVDAMFRGRAAIFRDKLGWEVHVDDGRECDPYDALNPLYVIALDDETDEVVGSIRLMPTTGPTLQRDIFAGAFDDDVDLVSATIWEATRFCVHPGSRRKLTPTRLDRATCEIAIAMCEIGLRAGLTQYIGIFEPHMQRIYRRIGWAPEVLARSTAFETGPIAVGLWDVTAEALADIRGRAGIHEDIIVNGARERVRFLAKAA
ncbi:MAG: acyl-homoserine-lactone synthase [Salinarimonas sp.]